MVGGRRESERDGRWNGLSCGGEVLLCVRVLADVCCTGLRSTTLLLTLYRSNSCLSYKKLYLIVSLHFEVLLSLNQ